MVMHVFDNSNLSQEIFAIDTWGAVICFLGHGRKHILTILPTIWRPGFTLTVNIENLFHGFKDIYKLILLEKGMLSLM